MSCLIDTIRETNPEWQTMFDELAETTTLSLLIVTAWQLGRVLAVRMVEETLARRAQAKTEWREVKVAIFARLGTRRTRAGKQVSQLHRHRVTAVLGILMICQNGCGWKVSSKA
jgi:hypothetical protein